MKCPKCGNILSDNAKFCTKCGMKQPEAGFRAPGRDRGQGTSRNTAPRSGPPRVPPPKKHSNAPVIIAIIAALLVIGCITVGATMLIVNKQEKTGDSSVGWTDTGNGGKQQVYPKETMADTSQAPRETSASVTQAGSPGAVTAPAKGAEAGTPAAERTEAGTPVGEGTEAGTPAAERTDAGTPAAEGAYILPDSNTRYLTDQDLAGLSADQLRLARNEIYARHGRKFKDEQLQAYFDSQPWYRGTVEPDSFKDNELLNDVERKNLELIKAREAVLSGTKR